MQKQRGGMAEFYGLMIVKDEADLRAQTVTYIMQYRDKFLHDGPAGVIDQAQRERTDLVRVLDALGKAV
jgi:hypothetical protein